MPEYGPDKIAAGRRVIAAMEPKVWLLVLEPNRDTGETYPEIQAGERDEATGEWYPSYPLATHVVDEADARFMVAAHDPLAGWGAALDALTEAVEMRDYWYRLFKAADTRAEAAEAEVRALRAEVEALKRAGQTREGQAG